MYQSCELQKNTYHKGKSEIRGPSIIFHRYHKKGVIKIQEVEYGEQPVYNGVVDFDTNSLYLWSLKQTLHAGPFTNRQVENKF